ncbi:MAG TPA: AAA family ATPase [Thermoanaerobaculia bacterium]|nr:AAA family ATPase [Thermoanaerobaculia bacterium]
MNGADAVYRFGRFELQPRERRLLSKGRPVPLPGKAFDLLVCLVSRAPRLVRKDELLTIVWPDTIVEETNLNYTISLIRKALLDGRGGQRCIETVPRQGYRFVGRLEAIDDTRASRRAVEQTTRPQLPLVQRESEIEALESALLRARSGQRQVVFITGEAGIGKTSLVERFLTDLRSKQPAIVARGQCVEHRGEAEAYMPVLEALGRLGRQADGHFVVEILDRYAPSWLVQMPGLIAPERLAALQQRLVGQTRERMLREIDEALVMATAVTPLVLVVEDLHWSDLSTIDLLARAARSNEPARLLIVGTYRSADALANSHPLHATVQELLLRGACQQIRLGPLSRSGVTAYLHDRFGNAVPGDVIDLIHHRTEGSPLFVTALIESWRAAAFLVEQEGLWSWQSDAARHALAVPESLRAFIEEQVRRLPRLDCEVLETAALVGAEISPVIVASALERPLDEIETVCLRLSRSGQFIRPAGTLEYPDGTVTDRYEFVHTFHIEVLDGLLPAGRRLRLHQRVALTLEALYGDRASDLAARLATHFLGARDARHAVKYLQLSAAQSLARSAPREAITRLEQAHQVLSRIPDIDERREYELSIQSMLAQALTATRGFSDAAAEAAHRRAYELARNMETSRLFPIAFGLATVLELRGEYRESQALMEEHLPAQEAGGGYVAEARNMLACSTYHQGAFDAALEHALKGVEHTPAGQHSTLTGGFGEHPGIGCYTWAALSLWFLGRPDHALEYARRAVALAESPGHLYSLASARAQLAILHQLRREPADAERWSALTIELGERQGFPHRVAVGQVLHGWARGAQGNLTDALAELERGVEGATRIGMVLDRPYFLALRSELLAANRECDRALATIAEAQAEASRSRAYFYEAELWRLRGAVLAEASGSAGTQEARDCFERAVETASRQGARILLLRAQVSRARSYAASRGAAEAVKALGAVYSSFAEGMDTVDLLDAARFLGRAIATPT